MISDKRQITEGQTLGFKKMKVFWKDVENFRFPNASKSRKLSTVRYFTAVSRRLNRNPYLKWLTTFLIDL